MKRPRILLRFDGLFQPVFPHAGPPRTAGFLCYGWIVTHEGRLAARGHGAFARWKDANSNIAEYLALIEGLEALLDMGLQRQPIRILGDARSVIDQMRGAAAVNSARTRPLYQRANRLAARFYWLEWTWLPRKNNGDADKLTRRALSQVRADRTRYLAALQALIYQKSQQPAAFLPLLDLCVYQPLAAPGSRP